MGNTQAGEKPYKTGKSPAKGKHFIRNLNRKSSGKDSKKQGRKKSTGKREAPDKELDKTSESDNNETIEASDNDTAECVFKTSARDGGGVERTSVHSEVTGTRCEPQRAERRSPTRDQLPVAATAASPGDPSSSDSVFTDPLTPLAVELNQCYYSAESDSAHEEPSHTLTLSQSDEPAKSTSLKIDGHPAVSEMPHDDTPSPLSGDAIEKEIKSDVFDDISDKDENEKDMGAIITKSREETLNRKDHECNHDFLENRLKACQGQTSFTISRHRKVELPPVAAESSLNILDNDNDRRHSSVSDVPMSDSNVLRKVASLTLDKHTESKVVRPKFVPEKLDFQLYEKFEGQMLLNWFLSSVTEDNHLKHALSCQDLKTLSVQYCTHLLAAGVLRQIPDKDAPTESLFKPNLMYYWSHMELPASQPVTPGKLDMSSWPPEKETNQQRLQDENDEIYDLVKAKSVISELRNKLQELEYQLENYKVNTQFSVINKKLQNSFISTPENLSYKDRIELISREVQTNNAYENNRLDIKPVIHMSKDDNHRSSSINMDTNVALSKLGNKQDLIAKDNERKPESRSEKIENYCKLNKSRDSNMSYWKDDLANNIGNDNNINRNREKEILCMNLKNYDQHMKYTDDSNVALESSSDASFLSTTTELINEKSNKSSEIFGQDKNVKNITNSIISSTSTQVLFTKNDLKGFPCQKLTDISTSEINQSLKLTEEVLKSDTSAENTLCQPMTPPPPPLPGMSPSPPPMPGTFENIIAICNSQTYKAESPSLKKQSQTFSKADIDNSLKITEKTTIASTLENKASFCSSQVSVSQTSISTAMSHTIGTELTGEQLPCPTSSTEYSKLEPCMVSSHPVLLNLDSPSSMTSKVDPILLSMPQQRLPTPSISDLGPTPSPIPSLVPPGPSSSGPSLPPILNMKPPVPQSMLPLEPSPSPMPSIGPPPPLMPDMEPPPSPMLSMGPPPPPMPDMGSPSPTMPCMGPPPPPMPDMGPPPPPMPCMGPPPPPMSGVGPPPPPMPGMGPPPPPMPGMGPPPPPMPGMGPPPPPMPGMGPPPPPMPGMGPPPPPMPGIGPPPPPMPGMGPPPPPMPGMGPPPPPMPGMGPPPPSISGIGPPPPPMTGMGLTVPNIPGVPPPPLIPVGHAGPLPFPAPPVGGWNVQRATLRKTPIKPAAPMKPLYWTRILAAPLPPTCQGEADSSGVRPLWLEIEEAKLDNIDEFTDLFSRQVVKAPVKKKVEVKTKIQPVKILDSKRSQNVGILAQSLHVEFSEIENAIYNFDTSVVSLEALQQIYELRASEEELKLIKEHLNMKAEIPLDKPEAFLHDLSGIQNFAERISCFMFQAEFDDAVNTIMHKLDNLKHTCEFLMTNESLKQLFAIILALGNYMNGGNGQRGQADGFGLEILAKLKDVKSKQSNVTLLHFIVRTYMKSRGGALSSECALPVPEPGDVQRAAAIDFAEVANSLATLRTNLDECKSKVQKVIEEDASQKENENASGESSKRLEVFKDKMSTFLNAAEEKLKTENENMCECRNKFIATVKFYQYASKNGKIDDCEPKEFFCLWTSFCSDFKDIYKKEEQIAIKEKLKETKKLQCERRANTQPKKEGGLKARLQKLSSSRK